MAQQRGKKLRGNGIWEATRMMLPQHKEAIRTHRSRLGERAKPELDEQRIEELSLALAEALESGSETAVTVFGPFEDETSVGIVEKVDPLGRYVKLASREETVWIPFGDIVQITVRKPARTDDEAALH
ncbi:YolD-like family protein [Paenibacillus thermotolerans]|uniref:YolD-like family protein n=1 Tax=Paenibacillus thermotolerans TaxID=3027807 RepID=UPI002367941A|nr:MULTISPECIES: YolD-like family protein [unclassified Paenibacillus]